MKNFQQYALDRITDTLTGQYDQFTTADEEGAIDYQFTRADEERDMDFMMWQASAIDGDFFTDGMEDIVGTEREMYWQHWHQFGIEHGYFEDFFPIGWTRRFEDFTNMVASEDSDAGHDSNESGFLGYSTQSPDYYQMEQEERDEDSTTNAYEETSEEENQSEEEGVVVPFSMDSPYYSPVSPDYYQLYQEFHNTTIDLTADSNDTIYLD
jgi:hypothetical protein